MAEILDIDPRSNGYFFITGFNDTFGAGKNSFTLNCTNKIPSGQNIDVKVYDPNGNALSVSAVETPGSTGIESSNYNIMYVVTIPESTTNGIGQVEISSICIDTGNYTGSIAYFNNQAYPIDKNTRLPIAQTPNTSPFATANIKWNRNILINTSRSTLSQVRFFDVPYIKLTPEIYKYIAYPTGTYHLASGSCSSIAIKPKNNDNGNFDYNNDVPIYQLFAGQNCFFSASMEGEDIRIKTPHIRNFTYANYSNNQITFSGVLNTDFIATISKVVNNKTLLLNIPFSVVSDLIERTNEDSIYNKNNLVDIFGYNISNDPKKQTVYKKKNFYILSISSADYEIFYKDIPNNVASPSGSVTTSFLNAEFYNLRTYCGKIDSYKIYGRSMNCPEYKILLCEGKIGGEELISSKNFNNGLYNHAGVFYSQDYSNRFWLTGSSAVVFKQDHSGYINGAMIGNSGSASGSEYVIFKDDTVESRTSTYANYNLVSESYWYGNSDAFLNSAPIPTASYEGLVNIPKLLDYTGSMENLLSGVICDSNPIHLRHSTLYKFSMNARPFVSNTTYSAIDVYFITGNRSQLIGTLNSTFDFGSGDQYYCTFFSSIDQFGTIKLVPYYGQWYISNISLVPYSNVDYSIDSFSVKIPLRPSIANELYEIESELYDASGNLAYGVGSYSFENNTLFKPLKKKVFIDPKGLTTVD